MPDNLENLAGRFFDAAGVVDAAGYRTIEVLLEEKMRPYFEDRDHLLLTFSTDVAKEHPGSELLTFGSPTLESMAEAAQDLGGASHFYLSGLNLTTGRTLEKVSRCAPIPGYVLETGEERCFLYHHAYFSFKTSLISEEREEMLHNMTVDMHSGWVTSRPDPTMLMPYASAEPEEPYPETPTSLNLHQAGARAVSAVEKVIVRRLESRRRELSRIADEEKEVLNRHYKKMISTLKAGKRRKGANSARIDDKIRAAETDRQHRLEDVDRKFRLYTEFALMQVALVSYPKAAVPLLIRQGKTEKLGLAVWDPLIYQGYFHLLDSPGMT